MGEQGCEHGPCDPGTVFLGVVDAVKYGWEEASLPSVADCPDVVWREAFLEVVCSVLPFHAHRVCGEGERWEYVCVGMVHGDPWVWKPSFDHQGELPLGIFPDSPQSEGGVDFRFPVETP